MHRFFLTREGFSIGQSTDFTNQIQSTDHRAHLQTYKSGIVYGAGAWCFQSWAQPYPLIGFLNDMVH